MRAQRSPVSPVSPASCDFLAGNTRLRARWPDLLSTTDHDLVGRDLAGLASALSRTAYRPHLDAAAARIGAWAGLRTQLEAAIGGRLAAVLSAVRGVYGGGAGDVVAVLLSRWDVQDLRTLLRGVVRAVPAEQVLPLVHGVGALTLAAAREIAEAPDVPTALERLAAAGLPARESGPVLLEAAGHYELHRDLTDLDHSVSAAAALAWQHTLHCAGRAGRPVADLVGAEVDAANLVGALRLRVAAEQGQISLTPVLVGRHLLPGGSHDHSVWARVAAGARPDQFLPAPWRPLLDRWERSGDLPALAGDLQAAVHRTALTGWRTDPLGAGVPVAYVLTAEREARTLRLLVHTAGLGRPTEQVDPPHQPA